jgi:hypothetical protein
MDINNLTIGIRFLLIVMGLTIVFWRSGNRSIQAMVGLSLITAASLVEWAIQFSETHVSPTTIQTISLISIGIMLAATLFLWFHLKNAK